MKKIDYSTLPEGKIVQVGHEYYIPAGKAAEFQNNGGVPRPNTLLNDRLINEYYLTWLDINEIGLEENIKRNLRQFRYDNDLVYWLIKNYNGKYEPVEVPKMGKDIVLPEQLFRHLSCPSAYTLFTLPERLLDKINTTVLVVLGIVALFISWMMMKG